VPCCWEVATICTADANCQFADVNVGVPVADKQVLS